jgi:hypothetical protein
VAASPDAERLEVMEHEACEAHCDDCCTCLGEQAEMVTLGLSGATYRDVPYIEDLFGGTLCMDCATPAETVDE